MLFPLFLLLAKVRQHDKKKRETITTISSRLMRGQVLWRVFAGAFGWVHQFDGCMRAQTWMTISVIRISLQLSTKQTKPAMVPNTCDSRCFCMDKGWGNSEDVLKNNAAWPGVSSIDMRTEFQCDSFTRHSFAFYGLICVDFLEMLLGQEVPNGMWQWRNKNCVTVSLHRKTFLQYCLDCSWDAVFVLFLGKCFCLLRCLWKRREVVLESSGFMSNRTISLAYPPPWMPPPCWPSTK